MPERPPFATPTGHAPDLARSAAQGAFDPAVLGWLRAGFEAWASAGGAVSLERCLRLPNTDRRARLAHRNFWLCEAARATGKPSRWGAAVALASEMDAFLSRGPWREWRGRQQPPAGAGQLRAALFYVATANHGRALTTRQISRCIGHAFG